VGSGQVLIALPDGLLGCLFAVSFVKVKSQR